MAAGPQPPEPCATMWSSKSRGRSTCGRDCPVTREPAPGLVETRDAVSGPPCASVGQAEGPGRGGGSAEPAVKSCIPVTTFESAVPASPSLGQPVSQDREGQVGRNPIEFMRHQMHQLVDIFCDRTQHQSQGAQQQRLSLGEVEDGFNEIMLEAVDLHHDQNDDEESSPLLPEVRQELRSRVLRSSVLDLEEKEHPEVQKTEESFCDRALRLFRRLLYQLQLKWQAALAWVREKVAAGLQAFCDAVEAVWSAFNSFCTSVAQVFRSAVQA
ncbi:interleukin-32 isoform X1 [Panthera onca]